MSPTYPAQHLLRQAAGAIAWGVFFILSPFSLVVLGSIIWAPLLAWRERRRAARYGFLPGAALRLAVVLAIVTIAVLLPVKYEDKRVRGLSTESVSLGELVAAGVMLPPSDESLEAVQITLPSTTPTRREVVKAICQQTTFRVSEQRCGTTATLLFGSSVGRISVSWRPGGPPA